MHKKLIALLFCFAVQPLVAQTELLTNFPKGSTPEEVGKLLSYRFPPHKHTLHAGKWVNYPETFYWNGAIKFATLTKNEKLLKLLRDRFDKLIDTEQALLPPKNHVDLNMFGSLPLELYKITKEQRYLDMGLSYADTQWQLPVKANAEQKKWDKKGYTWQTRMWIDDMYMITIVQVQAYRVTNDRKYIDRAAREMVLYLDELQRKNGLFYHAPDVPYYWSRGNGWMAAGMSELLKSLPQDSENRPRILKGYQTMMESLLKYQNEEGLWRQLLDKKDCWTETSGSAMFTFAFIMGVKNGWLDAAIYAPAARKAWLAMVSYIDENGRVKAVCEGTNKKNDEQYYYDRARRTGDYHGQAPYLWCVGALMEK